MATLQVRSIDDSLYKALGHRASRDNRSISQEVTSILKTYLSLPDKRHADATANFLELCGSWSDERSAEEIVSELRLARQNSSRFQETF